MFGSSDATSNMPRIVWNDAYSVGVAELDGHHRYLAELINRLAEYRQAPSDQGAVDEILAALQDYATYHFEAEERLLARCGFPHQESHQLEHRQFCEAMAELRYGATLGIVAIDRLFVFLTRWWKHHILKEDHKYKPFVETIKEPLGTP